MLKIIPLTLLSLSLSLGAPAFGYAATPRKVAGVTKPKAAAKKKKVGALKRAKKSAPAKLESLPNS